LIVGIIGLLGGAAACRGTQCSDLAARSDQPGIQCDPLPPDAGERGCRGAPFEDAGADAKEYPAYCTALVDSVRAGVTNGCPTELWRCQPVNDKTQWEPAGR